MKKITLILTLLNVVFAIGQVQKTNLQQFELPIEVRTAFEQTYPIKDVLWTSDYEGDYAQQLSYIAKFKVENAEIAAHYNQDGILKLIEESVPLNNLKPDISKYISDHYGTFKIKEAVKIIDSQNKTTYEVGITDNTYFFDLQFDDTGYFLQLLDKN
ncbi:PepSY-like domain-containing protein [Flavobacterium sp. 7A]|uniref:PepSY-like domain-containing protein n=1 Tax=Flavobacterium sp. 7A TaxID=2940571 RepID=UPI002226A06D|nr:PepSY-like domain-containing protein [Flavobacterium sp. 7A]MCW2118738.1 hypothetical protein [Flavobacterium sp. 7A]